MVNLYDLEYLGLMNCEEERKMVYIEEDTGEYYTLSRDSLYPFRRLNDQEKKYLDSFLEDLKE